MSVRFLPACVLRIGTVRHPMGSHTLVAIPRRNGSARHDQAQTAFDLPVGNSHRRFSAVQMKALLRQLLEILAFIHDNKYVHRDIKCSNLLIDNNLQLKVRTAICGRVTHMAGDSGGEPIHVQEGVKPISYSPVDRRRLPGKQRSWSSATIADKRAGMCCYSTRTSSKWLSNDVVPLMNLFLLTYLFWS